MNEKKYKIFIINLDRSKNRWEAINNCLKNLELPYERFSAIDGKIADNALLDKYYSPTLNRKKYYAPLTRNEIACYISHLKACEQIVKQNLDYGIIMEDDLVISKDFVLVPQAINAISKKWSYLKLMTQFKPKKIISREPIDFDSPIKFELVEWNKPPMGAQAYAITKQTAQKYIEKRAVFFRPSDVDLQFTWEIDLNIMGIIPSQLSPSLAESVIGTRKGIIYHYPLARVIHKIKYAISSLIYKIRK